MPAAIFILYKHPNIVTVYDFDITPGYHYTMEYLEGKTLQKLEKPVRSNFPCLTKIFLKIADALQHVHEKGIIHCDIKPSNIMLVGDEPKLVDFGIAQMTSKASEKSRGTEFYLSPEQAGGQNLDRRSDIYSLGVTLYELLAGEVPFPKGDWEIHSYQSAKSPKILNPEIPDALAKICLKCLEKDPAKRYSNAKELSDALQNFLDAPTEESDLEKGSKLVNVSAIKTENITGGHQEVNIKDIDEIESSTIIDVSKNISNAEINENIQVKKAKDMTALKVDELKGGQIKICITGGSITVNLTGAKLNKL